MTSKQIKSLFVAYDQGMPYSTYVNEQNGLQSKSTTDHYSWRMKHTSPHYYNQLDEKVTFRSKM